MAKTKRQRFLEQAPRRVTAALRAIERVGKCGNRAGYESSDQERDAIFDALDAAIVAAHSKFDPPTKAVRSQVEFTLPSESAGASED